jgi:hypothetical protein
MTMTGNASTPDTGADVDASAIALRIAASGPDMGIEVPKSAPDSGNTGKVSPDDRQPDSTGKAVETKSSPAPTVSNAAVKNPPASSDKAAQPGDSKAAEETAALEAEQQLIRARMGLKVEEPETIESLRRMRAESSREAHRLIEEAKLRDAVLSENNLKIVKKADGSYGILADDAKIAENMKSVASSVLSKLTADERDLVHDDVANKLIKETLAAVAVTNPKVRASQDDVLLPDSEVQNVLNTLASDRLPDKSETYQGLTDNDFVSFMQEIYSSPALEPFRVVANRSADNMKEFLKLVHGAVYRGYASVLAKKTDKIEQKKAKEDEHSREPSPSGSGINPVDMKAEVSKSASELAARIAKAG